MLYFYGNFELGCLDSAILIFNLKLLRMIIFFLNFIYMGNMFCSQKMVVMVVGDRLL